MSLQQLLSYVPGIGKDYVALSKKDDDFGIEEVKAWQKKFPLDQNYSNQGYTSIVEYCHKLVKSIKLIPYTHSTSGLIGDHLVELARQSAGVRNLLCDQLNMFHGTFLNEELRLELADRVWKVVSEAE